MAGADLDRADPTSPDGQDEELLARYVDAFERYDVTTLVALLHEDAVQSMPPFALWLRGRDEIGAWYLGQGIGCRGGRLVATRANGRPAFGNYRVSPDGGHAPFAIQLLDITGNRISGLHNFLYPELFEAFGLPAHLD